MPHFPIDRKNRFQLRQPEFLTFEDEVLNAPGPGKLARLLSTPGLSQALISGGAALLSQADQPGNLAGAIGRAIPHGFGGFRRGRARAAVSEALEGAPESMRRLISSLPPEQSVGMALQMLQAPKRPDPVTLSEGAELRDPETGELVAENVPEPPDLPSDFRLFALAQQLDPEQRGEFVEFIRNLRSGTTVNIGDPSPVEKVMADLDAGDLEAAREAARAARRDLGRIEEIERLLEAGVPTGSLEEITLPLKQVAASFGVGNVEQLSQQETFQALTNTLALGLTSELPGQISNKELDFLRSSMPNLRNTPEGNRRLIQIARRIAQRRQEVAEAMTRYFRDNGSLIGFDEELAEIADGSLFEGIPAAPPADSDDPFADIGR